MADNVSAEERSRIMACVRSKDTTPEMLVRRIVHRLGYRFRLYARDLPGTPDIVLPRHRKVIDVRGCFWHMHNCGGCRIPQTRRDAWLAKLERNVLRDRQARTKLRRLGWNVLIVWECEARSLQKLDRRVRTFLER